MNEEMDRVVMRTVDIPLVTLIEQNPFLSVSNSAHGLQIQVSWHREQYAGYMNVTPTAIMTD